jgi:hypothetical protein
MSSWQSYFGKRISAAMAAAFCGAAMASGIKLGLLNLFSQRNNFRHLLPQ